MIAAKTMKYRRQTQIKQGPTFPGDALFAILSRNRHHGGLHNLKTSVLDLRTRSRIEDQALLYRLYRLGLCPGYEKAPLTNPTQPDGVLPELPEHLYGQSATSRCIRLVAFSHTCMTRPTFCTSSSERVYIDQISQRRLHIAIFIACGYDRFASIAFRFLTQW